MVWVGECDRLERAALVVVSSVLQQVSFLAARLPVLQRQGKLALLALEPEQAPVVPAVQSVWARLPLELAG